MAERTPLEVRCDFLREMSNLFYEQPGCSCGGPLHILLDDGNVRDGDIVFCYCRLHEADEARVRGLGLAILHELMFLTEAQRRLWWEHASIEEIAAAEKMVLVYEQGRPGETGYKVRPVGG